MSLNPLERKAALTLQPYFSSNPIIFDIGSNKGFWTDILVHNVSEMHLFEPNQRLLTYTMVKYDYLKNVVYNHVAVSDNIGETPFTVFYNENNGLSNIIQNPKWDYLPGVLEKVDTITLDEYWPLESIFEWIDFIKIDVEGAEMKVLNGATELLKMKIIKFIQIEKSEHYDFTPVPNFVRQFGYDIFHFDGENFVKYTDQEAENLYIMSANFTQDWNGEFKKNTKDLPKFETVLEIGCFEGLTTNYICDNLLKEGGRVVCIDPLTDEYLPGHKDNEIFKGQYERFIRNTAGRPVELIREKSREAHKKVKDLRFGLIYIDGDHTEDGVFMDGVMYWNQLLDTPKGAGGYMLFDDYGQSKETARGIDRFLKTQEGNYKLLVKDYQVLIQRLW